MDIGSVRLHERHLHSDPPTAERGRGVRRRHRRATSTSPAGSRSSVALTVVGIAGTITTVASGVLDLATYDRDAIDQRRAARTPRTHDFVRPAARDDRRGAAGAAVHAPRPRRRHRRRRPDLERILARRAGRRPSWSPSPTSSTGSRPPSPDDSEHPRSACPHPVTGQAFASPVPPGTGWPDDPAPPDTPVARDADDVRRLASDVALRRARRPGQCLRGLPAAGDAGARTSRVDKRASFADQPYWGRPIAGWGDPEPALLIVGLAPGRPRRQPHRPHLHRRPQRRLALRQPAPRRAGQPGRPARTPATGSASLDARMVATVRCAPPENKPTPAERDTCAPWIDARDRACSLPHVRAVVALGVVRLGRRAALRSPRRGPRRATPKPRFGHGAEVAGWARASRCSAATTRQPAEHLHRHGSPRRCSDDVSVARAARADRMSHVTLHAITVLGHDRPGIIAETTDELAGLGLNLEDSTMTLLRGHFAMMLICAGDAAGRRDRGRRWRRSTADGTPHGDGPRGARPSTPRPTAGTSWVLTVHGGDRPGIVSAVVGEVAAVGGNITDLTTRLAGDLYLLVAEVDLPAGVDVDAVERGAARSVADELGVGVTLRAAETDEL